MKKYLQIFTEKFGQVWSACMLCMVQGDLSVISFSHALTAAKTGTLTGLAYCLTLVLGASSKNTWFPVWITGVLTMGSDIIIHPTHFGDHWMEAACTGAAAASLCFMWERKGKK